MIYADIAQAVVEEGEVFTNPRRRAKLWDELSEGQPLAER